MVTFTEEILNGKLQFLCSDTKTLVIETLVLIFLVSDWYYRQWFLVCCLNFGSGMPFYGFTRQMYYSKISVFLLIFLIRNR